MLWALTAQTGRVTPAYLARNKTPSVVGLTAQTGRVTPAYLARNNVLSAVGLTAQTGLWYTGIPGQE